MRTSWLRVRTPVFSKSCCSTALTELSEMASRAPISLLVSPSNTPLSTACSRWVKPCVRAGRGRITGGRGDNGTGHCGVEPDLSGNHLPDGIDQPAGGTVLQKDSGRTVLQRAQHHRIAHPGGHHQNAAGETGASRPIEKQRALLMAKIVIQQNDVDLLQLRQRQRLARRSAGAHDVKVRLGL